MNKPRRVKWWRAAGAAMLAVVASLALVACGGEAPNPGGPQPLVTPKPGPVTIGVRDLPGLGPVLVDGRGYTLYVFPPDNAKQVTCTDACEGSWPPVTVPTDETVQAGRGVQQALLGTDIDQSGARVVTYAGWPLYAYAGDVAPGQANGQGLNLNGDSWFVMNPAGKAVVPPEQQGVMPPGSDVVAASPSTGTMPGMSGGGR